MNEIYEFNEFKHMNEILVVNEMLKVTPMDPLIQGYKQVLTDAVELVHQDSEDDSDEETGIILLILKKITNKTMVTMLIRILTCTI